MKKLILIILLFVAYGCKVNELPPGKKDCLNAIEREYKKNNTRDGGGYTSIDAIKLGVGEWINSRQSKYRINFSIEYRVEPLRVNAAIPITRRTDTSAILFMSDKGHWEVFSGK
jgi:hypothetical protein